LLAEKDGWWARGFQVCEYAVVAAAKRRTELPIRTRNFLMLYDSSVIILEAFETTGQEREIETRESRTDQGF
jgi:hypothetical protein